MNKEFDEIGYKVVRNVIPWPIAEFITQYALIDEVQNFTEEERIHAQVANSHSRYADPAMETVLLHLQETMEKETGLSLFPTYSYYRVYRNGHSLAPHTDRPSCEISATVCFDYSYDKEKFSWPIYMAGKEVILNPGDVAIYKGCEVEHWRNKLEYSEKVWQVQGFFHYVNANGPNKEWKFDKRPNIGYKRSQVSTQMNNQSQFAKSYVKQI